ncbi:MAG: YiiD C-terminal domain-containing protein [Chlamydiales bacterium]|nr:YiiD C-terminal domain-containing protein [Chlamydiia bacterium]MCP5508049.1 YiiD C-terminal domain-containing protein [Chlamydiales bacterium]
MDAAEMERYLHEQIPISQAMGVGVRMLTLNEAVVTASFHQNINHKKTVFGGSLSAVATLSCWSLLRFNLLSLPASYEIVITHSDVEYLAAVKEDFEARAGLRHEEDWERFLKTLEKRGRARLTLTASINVNGVDAVRFTGTFAAIGIG